MHTQSLPSDVQRFLREVVVSIEHLDVLLLLVQTPRSLTISGVARSIHHLTHATIEHALSSLCARGLLTVAIKTDLHYAYGPINSELDRLTRTVLDLASRQRADVEDLLRR